MNFFNIAFTELKILLKDKSALVLLFVMPLVLVIIISLALQDVYQDKVGKKLTLNLIQEKPSKDYASIKEELEILGFKIVSDKNLSFKDSNLHGIIELPEEISFEENAPKIKASFNPTLDNVYRNLIIARLLSSLQSFAMKSMVKEMNDQEISEQVKKLMKMDDLLGEANRKDLIPNPLQQAVPAWSLFAIFFIVIPMTNSIMKDRRNGVYARLSVYPVSKFTILAGKLFPFFIINFLQFILMLAVGLYVMPYFINQSFNHVPLSFMLLMVILTASFAATGYGLFVATFFKSHDQATAFGAVSVMILALLGGIMVPHFVMPEAMKTISKISPLYWGLEAYFDVFLRNVSINDTLFKLFILATFGSICYMVALKKFKWSLHGE